MELKIYWLLYGLMRIWDHVLIFGGRKSFTRAELPIFLMSGCRSTCNTRIECLWYDFTNGVGGKWKEFFIDLEINHGLLGLPSHILLKIGANSRTRDR
jgi:hypothetical protein